MSLSLIITCIIIFITLIIILLFLRKKAEDNSKNKNEWDKIKEYGKKINEETRNNNK